jgi:hypothetical protein
MEIKTGSIYLCKNHDESEFLAMIIKCPSKPTAFSDVGGPSTHIGERNIFFHCIASSFPDPPSILFRACRSGFKKFISKEVSLDELILFIGWNCTKRYQDLLTFVKKVKIKRVVQDKKSCIIRHG